MSCLRDKTVAKGQQNEEMTGNVNVKATAGRNPENKA